MSAPDAALLDSADRIGARLCRDAVWAGPRCNWLGWALDVVGRSYAPVFRAQTGCIYDGTAGIALYLGRLASFTDDSIQRETAIGALNQALAAESGLPEQIRASFYSGGVGIAYATIELGKLFQNERLMTRGLAQLERAASFVEAAGWLDVLGGTASTIQALLAVDPRGRRDAFVMLATAHGRRLLEAAVRSDRGWSWDTLPGQTANHLVGYGHGAGGIGCALLELWAATGDVEYRHAALEAFRYERSFFSQEHTNWPDLRIPATPSSEPVYAAAWCHGGPGIGLSRLRAVQLTHDDAAERDLAAALELTSRLPNGAAPVGGLCLCHGLGGNMDLLIEAAAIGGEHAGLRELAERAALQTIATYVPDDLPWPCGVNGGGETPNLMLGLAGIGHFFLRLHDPERVPSILLLRRPCADTEP